MLGTHWLMIAIWRRVYHQLQEWHSPTTAAEPQNNSRIVPFHKLSKSKSTKRDGRFEKEQGSLFPLTYVLLSLLKFFSIKKQQHEKATSNSHVSKVTGFSLTPPTCCPRSPISVNTNSTHQLLKPKGLHQFPLFLSPHIQSAGQWWHFCPESTPGFWPVAIAPMAALCPRHSCVPSFFSASTPVWPQALNTKSVTPSKGESDHVTLLHDEFSAPAHLPLWCNECSLLL